MSEQQHQSKNGRDLSAKPGPSPGPSPKLQGKSSGQNTAAAPRKSGLKQVAVSDERANELATLSQAFAQGGHRIVEVCLQLGALGVALPRALEALVAEQQKFGGELQARSKAAALEAGVSIELEGGRWIYDGDKRALMRIG